MMIHIRQLLIVLALVQPAVTWWGGAHMLVVEVAKTQLSPSTVKQVDAVLRQWSKDFETTEATTASVWADHVRCTAPSSFCPFKYTDNVQAFNAWHFSSKPYNPDNVPLTEKQLLGYLDQPSAIWALSSAVTTFRGATSNWGWNFMLRFLLHLVGDMHMPLHCVTGYFNNDRIGVLPSGDTGGNAIPVNTSCCSNLHALWDSGGGVYLENFPLDVIKTAVLMNNATELVKQHPKTSLPQYNATDFSSCWRETINRNSSSSSVSCSNVFNKWNEEGYNVAVQYVYPGINEGWIDRTTPSEAYLATVRNVSRAQITLAGYRLADAITEVATALPVSATAGKTLTLSASEVAVWSAATAFFGLVTVVAGVTWMRSRTSCSKRGGYGAFTGSKNGAFNG